MTAGAYTPQPGTLPARAVEHLRSLAPGAELSTAVLAEALGQPSGGMTSWLSSAVNAGLIASRRKPGDRSLWWSLGDGVPIFRARGDDDEGLDIDAAHRVSQAPAPAPSAPAAPTPRKKPCRKPVVKTAKLTTISAQPIDRDAYIKAIERTVPADPEPAADYDFGLFRSGQFIQTKGDQRIVLDRIEFESLVHFLERMAVGE